MIEVPSPLQSASVIGHNEAKEQIISAYDSGRMHHAWLITGQEGIGKATLAIHMAHLLLSKGENRFSNYNAAHASARLVSAGSHPDFFILKCPLDEKTGVIKNLIPVDEARKVAPFLRMTASHGGGRVALVDEAHKLNRNAQNALLKIIEEPTKGSTIIMTASTVASLLPTIRSRCHVLALESLSGSDLEMILMRMGVDLPQGPDKARFLDFAGGSAGRALKLLQSDGLQIYDEVMRLLADLPYLNVSELHKIAGLISKKSDSESFEIVVYLLTQTLRSAVRAAALDGPKEAGLVAKLTNSGRLDKLLDLCEKIEEILASAQDSNLDKKLVFIDAITEIKRCAE